uniref:Uncharacterized protein n=1 Tax=Rhizophora mucronata TaxID=61149 RepID=A0A2P2P9C8_RHIMU
MVPSVALVCVLDVYI